MAVSQCSVQETHVSLLSVSGVNVYRGLEQTKIITVYAANMIGMLYLKLLWSLNSVHL